ncbi:parvulin-like peptidyl-prolyl isomerase [Candidatus Endolissoclinum faulkneri L5]|uniref:Parvulin-like PPIase n=1 Tax=Candidatus Endolissoclinum faulkneri L5 TaxID=1401328 RepID=V9TVL6_9PROT|nr:peptidylprolyl isomerase [Candidatus Endolissoclinum faulkneri]AHC73733.1 parvulin-like peptidyl-prolyl isomerase [Candidatus Endolissoclinum faulkneri L5]
MLGSILRYHNFLILSLTVCISTFGIEITASLADDLEYMQRIAAVVNDEVISFWDLRNRIDMVIITSKLPRSYETALKIAPRILNKLIDEQIQIQEAKKMNINIQDSEMDRALSDIEKSNGLRAGQFHNFILHLGINPSTVEHQLRSNLLWIKLVNRHFANQVEVSTDEVNEISSRLADQSGHEQKLVSEILLTVDDRAKENEVLELANQLVKLLRYGASFKLLAQQFSQASNASIGGDIGWVLPEEFTQELSKAIQELSVGEITEPIRTVFGYHILRVNNTRVIARHDPRLINISLGQIFLSMIDPDDVKERKMYNSKIKNVIDKAKNCEHLAVLAKEAGSSIALKLEKLSIAELPKILRSKVENLQVGEKTAPIDLPNGVLAAMLCERNDQNPPLEDLTQIRRNLENQRLRVLAQGYLRELRQASFIETRV